MCGRYLLSATPDEVTQAFGISVTDNFPPRYNIAPTQPVAIIRQNPLTRERDREYALVRWGFIPSWSKGGDFHGRPLINARSETVHEKNSYKSAYARRRCLFPVNGFYEWRTEKGAKQPYCMSLGEAGEFPLFALAGIWEHWMGADGTELETAAILTQNATGEMRAVHHREPVMVGEDDFETWLHADETAKRDYGACLDKPRETKFNLVRVSKEVGNVRNEGAALIAPDQGETGSLI